MISKLPHAKSLKLKLNAFQKPTKSILTRSLPKGSQKQDLLCVQVKTSLGVNNFRNTGAIRLIF